MSYISNSGLSKFLTMIKGVFASKDTFTRSADGLVPHPTTTTQTRYLREDMTWQVPPDTNTNTDVNVTQNHSTVNAEYPVLLKNGTGIGNVTSTSVFDGDVTVNPSTGTITASTFKGALSGNASTATSAGSCTGNAATATTAGNVTGTVAIANGGTGKTNPSDAWTALGGGSVGKLSTGSSTTTYLRNDGQWATPPNTNTDTNVTQNHSTANGAYPILLKNGTGTGNVTTTSIFDGDVTVNPSTGVLTASGFSGPLTGNVTGNCSGSSGSCTGNAATATKLGTATVGANNTPIYLNGGTATAVTAVDIAHGGTGATSAANAWTNLSGDDKVKAVIGALYPVGAIYLSINDTNPSTYGMPGTWALQTKTYFPLTDNTLYRVWKRTA